MKKKGFTLIELLVVIAIIGVLAATAILLYSSVQQRARDGKRKDNLNQIEKALAFYTSVNSIYPDPTILNDHIDKQNKWEENNITYMEKVPNDPSKVFDPTYTSYQYFRSIDN